MIPATRSRLLSVVQPQSRNQIQNHILGLKSVKSAPKIFTPPDSSPAPARRCELGARLPAFGLPNFSRPPSPSFLSSSSFIPILIPRVLSSRVLHTTAKMSNEIVHPTIQGRSAAESHPHLVLIPRPALEIFVPIAPPWPCSWMAGHAVESIGTCFCKFIEYFYLMCRRSRSCEMLDMT